MSNCPFIVQRPPFFSINQLKRIEEAMLRILEEVGIAILDEKILEQLMSCGFQINSNRVFIHRKRVSEFLDTERERNGNQFSEIPQSIELSSYKIGVSIIEYAQWVHDLESDKIVPFDTERLIEATKLLDVLSISGVPGCPTDVPPPLQPVVQYWVSATYSRHGRRRVDPKSLGTLPYIMEMGEALGNPLRHLPIYIFSPLTVGSESLRCVLAFKNKLSPLTKGARGLSSVGVSNMPSVGCTAPINIGDAYALSAAEVIGSAILLSEIIDLHVNWGIGLFPIDLRTLAMVFGSPENFLLQLATSEVNAYFHGTRWYPAAGNIHTNAKLPGAQSCAEKASLMTAGALLGARGFGSVGLLSLDEVFSAEQLIYDLEIRDHVQRLIQGVDGDCDPERCLKDIKEGLQQKSFVAIDSTLNGYRQFYWHPKLFDRQFFSAWEGEGANNPLPPLIRGTNRQKAHAMIKELLSQHEYELETELRNELDKILAKARAELLG
jgi:trimethylamine:corrinoid methyltransferase-like protein